MNSIAFCLRIDFVEKVTGNGVLHGARRGRVCVAEIPTHPDPLEGAGLCAQGTETQQTIPDSTWRDCRQEAEQG